MLKSYHLFILRLLISFAAVSGLLFTPALPSLAKDLSISEAQAQWIIAIFLVGYCLGILPYGSLSNRFGRKKANYIGVCLAIVGSLPAYASTSFWMLCAARFLQAFGSSAGLKISFTMIADVHQGMKAAKSIALMFILWKKSSALHSQ